MNEWRDKKKEDKINKEVDAFYKEAFELKDALNDLINQLLLLLEEYEDKNANRKRQKQIEKEIHNFYVRLKKQIESE